MTVAYLDYAATTPMRSEAVDAMLPHLSERFGNPSGGHAVARDARCALEDAREVVAECLGAEPHDVVFTAGGTEADNLAVRGAIERRGGIPVCPATEHHAVLHPVEHYNGRVIGVQGDGRVAPDELGAALSNDVTIVSIMLSNNESGVVQPLGELVQVVRAEAPQALVHTDAVQAVSWLDVAALASEADMISISAHKFGGPKGVGALVCRRGVELAPQILGGGQEQDRRSGTQNVAGIVALAAALGVTVRDRELAAERVGTLRNRLVDRLIETVPGTAETGDRSVKVPSIGHIVFEGIETEALLVLLERDGVMASAAASCAAGAIEPSHVLAAMGYDRQAAAGSLRLSLGHMSTDADIDTALEVIPPAVKQLRR